MVNNGVENLAPSSSGNFPLECLGIALDLPGKNPLLAHIERSLHLAIMQPAMIHLFLVIPAARGYAPQETSKPAAENVHRSCFIQEHAHRVLLTVEKIRGQNACSALGIQRMVDVSEEIVLL